MELFRARKPLKTQILTIHCKRKLLLNYCQTVFFGAQKHLNIIKVTKASKQKIVWDKSIIFLVFLEQLRQKKALKTQNINNPLLKKIHAKLSLISIFRLKKHL